MVWRLGSGSRELGAGACMISVCDGVRSTAADSAGIGVEGCIAIGRWGGVSTRVQDGYTAGQDFPHCTRNDVGMVFVGYRYGIYGNLW